MFNSMRDCLVPAGSRNRSLAGYVMPALLYNASDFDLLPNIASVPYDNVSLPSGIAFPVTGAPMPMSPGSGLGSNPTLQRVRAFVKTVLVPSICVLGVIGNALTLLVLRRKRLTSSCDGTERTVHIGLLSLAVSDLLCCLSLFPHGFFGENQFSFQSVSFQLVYQTYGQVLINIFILTSTWLTVTMATSRYLAICHPFRARHMIGLTGTRVSIILVFIVSVMFNIPRFFEYYVESIRCVDGRYEYLKNMGYMRTQLFARTIYVWAYFTIGIFLPLVLLAFCNICLVKALRESSKLRRRYRVPAAHVDSNYRITSILVTIVVMYILFVSPGEILLFLYERLAQQGTPVYQQLSTAVELTNVLQTINFACDFVLYFVLNVHFRHAMREMISGIVHKFFRCTASKNTTRKVGGRQPLYSQPSITRNSTTVQTVV